MDKDEIKDKDLKPRTMTWSRGQNQALETKFKANDKKTKKWKPVTFKKNLPQRLT